MLDSHATWGHESPDDLVPQYKIRLLIDGPYGSTRGVTQFVSIEEMDTARYTHIVCRMVATLVDSVPKIIEEEKERYDHEMDILTQS